MHLIIAHASLPQAASGLDLPVLQRLLQRLSPDPVQDHPEQDPAQPHERRLAQALGWHEADGLPLALWQNAEPDGPPSAWLSPCHWQIGMDQVIMLDPALLALSETESRTLLAAIAPLLQDTGLHIEWHSAWRWRLRGEPLRGLICPSPERVIGRPLGTWIDAEHWPVWWRRLHSELQMLLYTLPLHDERLAARQWPVNALWLHGSGAWPRGRTPHADVVLEERLLRPALHGDLPGWQAAWQAIETEHLAPLDLRGLRDFTLTLCSDTRSQAWRMPAPGLWSGLRQRFGRRNTEQALRALQPLPSPAE